MKKSAQNGFTLVELIITVLLAAIVLGLGVPAFGNFIDNSRMISTTNDLVTDLLVARSEAVKRNNNVTICASSNGTSCSGDNDWDTGWIVFDDVNANAVVDGAAILRRHAAAQDGGMSIAVTAGTAASFVSFNGDGFPRDANNVVLTATFSLCDHRGIVAGYQYARGIQLGASGRVNSTDVQGSIVCP